MVEQTNENLILRAKFHCFGAKPIVFMRVFLGFLPRFISGIKTGLINP